MIWSIIVGLVIGIIAKLIMPGKDPGGFIVTILLGIGGAALANFVGTQLNWYSEGEAAGMVASVVGAVILLAIYRSFSNRNKLVHH